jgi:hypothetical protein
MLLLLLGLVLLLSPPLLLEVVLVVLALACLRQRMCLARRREKVTAVAWRHRNGKRWGGIGRRNGQRWQRGISTAAALVLAHTLALEIMGEGTHA